MPNKALHWMAIPLRSTATSELCSWRTGRDGNRPKQQTGRADRGVSHRSGTLPPWADCDHKLQGSAKGGYRRVDTDDLNILIANWMVKEPPHGPGIPADCLDRP